MATGAKTSPPSSSFGRVRPRWRGWLHVGGLVVFALVGAVMVGRAAGALSRFVLAVYVVGLCTMFGASSLYHRGIWSPPTLKWMRRLDHSAIFVAIASTYTPVAVLCLDGWSRPAVLAAVWGGAVLGVLLRWLPVALPRWVFIALYGAIGWIALLVLPALVRELGPGGFSLILTGGICYALGAVVYVRQKPDPWPATFGFHEVFHGLTLIGAGLQMAAIASAIPRG